jgi:Protein of unknown function (DUF551)
VSGHQKGDTLFYRTTNLRYVINAPIVGVYPSGVPQIAPSVMDWIDVTVALPEPGVRVIIACPSLNDKADIGQMLDDGKWYFLRSASCATVTHWMPLILPKSPEAA